jgi:hypothetical protein
LLENVFKSGRRLIRAESGRRTAVNLSGTIFVETLSEFRAEARLDVD